MMFIHTVCTEHELEMIGVPVFFSSSLEEQRYLK